MNTIEGRLVRLISLQDDVTHLNENGASRGELMVCQAQRDAIRASIAVDWRAMIEALETILTIEDTVASESEARGQMVDIAHAILLRVKGE